MSDRTPAPLAPRADARRLLAALQAWQASETVHPLTCGTDSRHAILVPTLADGRVLLICTDCEYRQEGSTVAWIADLPAPARTVAEAFARASRPSAPPSDPRAVRELSIQESNARAAAGTFYRCAHGVAPFACTCGASTPFQGYWTGKPTSRVFVEIPGAAAPRSGDGDPPPPELDELLAMHRTAWIGYAAADDEAWREEWKRRGNVAGDAIRAALASQRAARARAEEAVDWLLESLLIHNVENRVALVVRAWNSAHPHGGRVTLESKLAAIDALRASGHPEAVSRDA